MAKRHLRDIEDGTILAFSGVSIKRHWVLSAICHDISEHDLRLTYFADYTPSGPCRSSEPETNKRCGLLVVKALDPVLDNNIIAHHLRRPFADLISAAGAFRISARAAAGAGDDNTAARVFKDWVEQISYLMRRRAYAVAHRTNCRQAQVSQLENELEQQVRCRCSECYKPAQREADAAIDAHFRTIKQKDEAAYTQAMVRFVNFSRQFPHMVSTYEAQKEQERAERRAEADRQRFNQMFEQDED